jgi:hypothetical protein
MQLKVAATFVAFLIGITSYAQNSTKAVEYLNVPGPIVVNKQSFNLQWSSHPSPTYYKQEYIVKGDNIERFKKMVLVEVLIGEAKAADLAKAKMADLKKMKETNPMVNYEMFQKDGEIIIDFLVSDNSPDGKKVNILERNIYRYKEITVKNGQKGIVLFGVSERSYGNEVDAYLASLKKDKSVLVNAVAAYTIPQLTIKK